MSGRCIAMWSGPRNISTAMMRAWENRPDTVVVDEPFYAHFLKHTVLDHPMADEIIASGETDWQRIVHGLTQIPDTGIYYQKHITTHWLDHYSTDWLNALDHVFLIRDPSSVVASYTRKRHQHNDSDLGYSQQARLFDLISLHRGSAPLVIDSQRFLHQPRQQLQAVCRQLQIPFDESMLSWPTGARDSDGIWASHWYDAVHQSTGFKPPRIGSHNLNEQQQLMAESCRIHYERLLEHAL